MPDNGLVHEWFHEINPKSTVTMQYVKLKRFQGLTFHAAFCPPNLPTSLGMSQQTGIALAV